MVIWYLVVAVVSLTIGSFISWLVFRAKCMAIESGVKNLAADLNCAKSDLTVQRDLVIQLNKDLAAASANLEQERRINEEKVAILISAREELKNAFGALAADALQSNNLSFLDLAKTKFEALHKQSDTDLEKRQKAVEDLVAPIETVLGTLDSKVQQLEERRIDAYATLTQEVRSLTATQEQLRTETSNLVRALRTPSVRGRWGEIQLKRVAEIAGMLPYCDFTEQKTVQSESGRLRPDLVVRLPGGKNIVVDAKTPLEGYLNAMATTDEGERQRYLLDHARQVRNHMECLGSKSYWEQFEPSPEFVVMFLPGEAFFGTALEHDPALIEHGVGERVIPASPTTLIALLRAVAYGWRQENLAQNAQQISDLGKELHDRIRSLITHFEGMGNSLHKAVENYNKLVGSLENRVLISTRKFAELGAPVTEAIPELSPIESTTRQLSPEWREQATFFSEDSAHTVAEMYAASESHDEDQVLIDIVDGKAPPLTDKASA